MSTLSSLGAVEDSPDLAATREEWEATEVKRGPECSVEHCIRPPYDGPVCKMHADLLWHQARTHAEHGRV